FLFHPDTDKCWLAYERGACPEEQYLVLPKDSMIPICVPNPCRTDSMVLWNGQCQKLGSSVCGNTFPAKVLWVNATTSTVDCVIVYLNNRFSIDVEFETNITCPLGCRRNVQNKCTPDRVL
ncbi:jg16078, partial [Pararge aegeria aegeria]